MRTPGASDPFRNVVAAWMRDQFAALHDEDVAGCAFGIVHRHILSGKVVLKLKIIVPVLSWEVHSERTGSALAINVPGVCIAIDTGTSLCHPLMFFNWSLNG